VRVDSQLVFNQAIEKVDVAETRSIYTLLDFKTMRMNGSKFYKLYIDDGNKLNFYASSPGTGKIKVSSTKESDVSITMKDSYGNKSTINFKIRPSRPLKTVSSLEPMTSDIMTDIAENTMMVTTKPCSDSIQKINIFIAGKSLPIEPNYLNANRAVYLLDLRKALPDSIVTCTKSIVTNFRQVVPAGSDYKYYSELMDVTFPEAALYDTLYFATNYTTTSSGREIFSIGNRNTPLNKSIIVSLAPKGQYAKQENVGVYRLAGKGYAYIGGEWVNDRINFTSREFGEFTILQDSIPPTIKPIAVDRNTARFKIRDDLSGIKSFEAKINGSWLLMNYDSKSATIWSEKLNKDVPLTGDFELVVIDNAGNRNVYTKRIL
jgi:hypothetical protein